MPSFLIFVDVTFSLLIVQLVMKKGNNYSYEDVMTGETSTREPVGNPARKLLELARDGGITDLYVNESVDEDVFRFFIQGVLAHVLTKRKWNVNAHVHNMGTFVNVTDEAFAMLLLEHNAELWMDIVDNPDKKKKDRPKQKYVHRTEGWTERGLIHYARIVAELLEWKENNEVQYDMMQMKVKTFERISTNGSAAKKRKRPDSVLVVSENNKRKKEMETAQAFIMSGGSINMFKQEHI